MVFKGIERGQWMALAAALLGWMFDGLEQGLFPLAGRPALRELLSTADEPLVARWFSAATAAFLVGAATGGVLFGWLGDRIGRVRAMTLSVLTYAVFSGLCAQASSAEEIVGLRFLSSVGMGGEWALGVALVMELWPDRSRSLLAGLIGAAANVGYVLLALIGIAVGKSLDQIGSALRALAIPETWSAALVANSGWRFLMLLGALPAVLTFLIRLFVPESERWHKERVKGTTTHWATRDLLAVCVGSFGACSIIYLWVNEYPLDVQAVATALALVLVTVGYPYPVIRFLQRSGGEGSAAAWLPTVRRMALGACLSGVPLLVTWGSVQWAPVWTDQITRGAIPEAKAYTQFWQAAGAVTGTIVGALLGGWLGRRLTYGLLCLSSLGATLLFFLGNDHFGPQFLATAFLAGGCTAAFYGWLPLYLPELFATRIRATGQGFSYNFGRILAAVGVLQTGNLTGLFGGDYAKACAIMSLMYLVGIVVICFAPETRGQPLPE